MIKCRNCSQCSLSVIRFKGFLLPLLVFVAITGSLFVEVDSVMEKDRAAAGGQVKVHQLSRDGPQSAFQSADPTQPQPQKQQQQQQPALPPTMTTSDISNTYKINSSTNTETVKIGNSKTKNYNFQESNYLPTQLTQVVLNVPKTHSRILRRTRPPTVDEFMIKRKILDVYEEAAKELSGAFDGCHRQAEEGNSRFETAGARIRAAATAANGQQSSPIHFNQLGRILQALNPKYIATERVRDAAFADPADPNAPVQLPDVPLQLLNLELSANDETSEPVGKPARVGNLLFELEDKFRSQVNWDLSFIEALAGTSNQQLEPTQLAFKRLLLCLNDPSMCSAEPYQRELPSESAHQNQQYEGQEDEEPDLQQAPVYETDDEANQELVYEGQAPDNPESEYDEVYDQYAPAADPPPMMAPPPPPSAMEPPRFRPRPPPYGLQNDRAYNTQYEPQPQMRVPNGWPTNEVRQPRPVFPDSVNSQNNINRPDAFRNRYQFQAQQPAPPQRYTYQRQPPQRQPVFARGSYS